MDFRTDQPGISVVILTYNEECNIRHALESVRWSDDVVVIDSFSTDGTEDICREYDNVAFMTHPFRNLASQRQYSLDAGLVKHAWVLALDADEVVPPELRDELLDIAAHYRPGDPVAYDIAMRLYLWGKWLRRSSEYPVYWRRFFRADGAQYVQAGHADKLIVTGSVGKTRHDLIHQDRHDLAHWLAKHNRYSSQEAAYALNELSQVPYANLVARDRALRRAALKRLFRSLPCSDVVRFLYLYVWRWGFLDGRAGWRYCRLKAQQAYHVALKIEELKTKRREEAFNELKQPTSPPVKDVDHNCPTEGRATA
jgi:glycosyltransferase involved in cell wall biosynthesis